MAAILVRADCMRCHGTKLVRAACVRCHRTKCPLLTPRTMQVLGGQGRYFQKLSQGSETLDMTSEGSGEMVEGSFADMCAEKFPLVSMGG